MCAWLTLATLPPQGPPFLVLSEGRCPAQQTSAAALCCTSAQAPASALVLACKGPCVLISCSLLHLLHTPASLQGCVSTDVWCMHAAWHINPHPCCPILGHGSSGRHGACQLLQSLCAWTGLPLWGSYAAVQSSGHPSCVLLGAVKLLCGPHPLGPQFWPCSPSHDRPVCVCRQELDSARQAAATHQKEAELRSAQAQQRKEVAERLAREVRGSLFCHRVLSVVV